MSTVAQIVGVLLIVLGVWLIWSPVALIIGGALLLLVPEMVAAVRRPRP